MSGNISPDTQAQYMRAHIYACTYLTGQEAILPKPNRHWRSWPQKLPRYLCMCVCTYVRTYACMRAYMYVCVNIYEMHMLAHTQVTQVCACMHYVFMYVHTHCSSSACTHASDTSVRMYVCIRMYVHTHCSLSACTHTQVTQLCAGYHISRPKLHIRGSCTRGYRRGGGRSTACPCKWYPLCVCLHVCVHVCVYIYVYVYMYMYVNVDI